MGNIPDPSKILQEEVRPQLCLDTALSEQEHLGRLSLEISTVLIESRTLDEMFKSCTDALVRHLDAAFARIWLLNEEDQVLELQASSGMYTHINGGHARVPVGALKIGLIASERKPHLTNNVIGDPRVGQQEWAKREGMVSFAGYPLLLGQKLIGVVALFARHPLNAAALQAMETIANSLALGIERLRMQEAQAQLLAREQQARSDAEQANQRLQELNANLEELVEQRMADLNQMNIELQRSNQDLQEFAYVASHDLQEPLRKIQAFGNLLDEEYGDTLGEGRTYLDRMRNAAGRMSVLIEDLLSFSRVSTRAQPFVPVDLNEVVRQVIDNLEARIRETRGTVEVGPLPTIEADPQQIAQVLQNLLSNALKFHMADVPPVVKLSAQLQEVVDEAAPGEEPSLQYQIFVEDNGIGFDEKYLDRIFTVFQRLHNRKSYAGTGIGLAIVRKIVERHRGSITAKSAPGQGATFIITIPVQKNLQEEEEIRVN